MAAKFKSAAVLTVFNLSDMTVEGRKHIAKWLRSRANVVEKHGDVQFAGRFTQRYLYDATPAKKSRSKGKRARR